MNDDELEPFLVMLNSRTSLEEILDWDDDLVEYLIGAWGVMTPFIESVESKEICISLLAAQLPADKMEKYQKKLENWLHDNYNMLVR